MNQPLETAVSKLCAENAGFNLVHFRDATHGKNAPAHFWVSISAGNDRHMLLSIVTTQMAKLEKKYRNDKEGALDCIVPLSNSDLTAIETNCVINCNAAMLLTTRELVAKIDTAYYSAASKHNFDFIHNDKDFDVELKNRIISAIRNSPKVTLDVKECADKLYRDNVY
jgi:hypothetical protein